MPSIVQHQHRVSQRPPRAIDLERVEQIAMTVRKFGAVSIKDIATEVRLSGETVRRHMANLMSVGRVVAVVDTSWGASALYGPADLDNQAEFDLYRTRTSNWQRGQHHRDPLVAALFGDAQTGGAA